MTPTCPRTSVWTAPPAKPAPGRAARRAAAARLRRLLVQRTASPAGPVHVGPGQGVFARPEDGIHKPQCLDPLIAGEGAGYMAPEHLRQDVECFLDLGNVAPGLEAVRRGLLAGCDDRPGVTFTHALDDELEQIPHVATALLRAGYLVVRLMASLERGNRFADDPIPGAGEDC